MKMKIIIHRTTQHLAIRGRHLGSMVGYGVLFLSMIVGSVGCGDETQPPSESKDPAPITPVDPPDSSDLLDDVMTESWGIGDQWYDYELSTHGISPQAISWVLVQDDAAYFFRVLRYYGDDGESGKPAMIVRRWEGSAFGEETTIKIESSIRSAPACIRFDTAEVVSCDDVQHVNLVWRTDRRPIPEEGFAVGNPALYATSQHGAWVAQYASKTPPDALPIYAETIARDRCASALEEDTPTQRDPRCETHPWRISSIFDEDAAPRVSLDQLSTHDVFQMTGTMHVAQWRAHIDDGAQTIALSARCVSTDYTTACTDTLEGEPSTLVLSLDDLAPWTFVDLCGPKGTDAPFQPTVSHAQDTLIAGRWPSNETFEVAIQNTDSDVQVWAAPSQPMHVQEHANFDSTSAPETLWSIPGPSTCDF